MARSDIEHEWFGTLHFKVDMDCYLGTTEFEGEEISLFFFADDDNERICTRARSLEIFSALPIFTTLAKDFAATQLLELKNESWLEEDEKSLSSEQFKQRMHLDTIMFRPDASVEFWYADGDLFWGHSIVVYMDRKNSFTAAQIEG
jgi:hypothetical protein